MFHSPPQKKAKLLDSITDGQACEEDAYGQAREEDAYGQAREEDTLRKLVWDSSKYTLSLCKKLSDELYRCMLDAVAVLVYLIFDKDDLYRMHSSCIIHRQRKEFWKKLEKRFNPQAVKMKPAYEACKRIVDVKTDWKKYPHLNEYDLGCLVSSFASNPKPCVFLNFHIKPDKRPYINVPHDYFGRDEELLESAMDDDIQEAIRKAKLFPRLSVDEYTSLLIEMVRNVSTKCSDFVMKKASEKIDRKVIDGLNSKSIEDLFCLSAFLSGTTKEKLKKLLEDHLLAILFAKKLKVRRQVLSSVMPYCCLFDYDEYLRGFDSSKAAECLPNDSTVVSMELIKVAELRRKAEGSRFIQRGHLLWAFDERGCGLSRVFNNELVSRMTPEDHPPYHIYRTSNILAQAEKKFDQPEHIAFAVIFGKYFGYSKNEVKKLYSDFLRFKIDLDVCWVELPKEGLSADPDDDLL